MTTAQEAPRTDCFLELQGLYKRFGSNEVLRGVDRRVVRGEIFTILGGSGSGKSVMLKHMIGLLRCDAGRSNRRRRSPPLRMHSSTTAT